MMGSLIRENTCNDIMLKSICLLYNYFWLKHGFSIAQLKYKRSNSVPLAQGYKRIRHWTLDWYVPKNSKEHNYSSVD